MCTKTVSRFFSLAELITPMHTKSMYNNSAVQFSFPQKINFLSSSGNYDTQYIMAYSRAPVIVKVKTSEEN